MKVGVPKEIKNHEYRVGVIPAGVHALVERGHEVVVQTGAGAKAGFTDQAYVEAGAKIVGSAEEAFDAAMVVKVKAKRYSFQAAIKARRPVVTSAGRVSGSRIR